MSLNLIPSPATGIWDTDVLYDNQGQPSATAYNSSDLLTTEEVASYLKLSDATLRNWRATKKGPAATRVGARAVRYRFSDLEAFIAASTAKVP